MTEPSTPTTRTQNMTERLGAALAYAVSLHASQRRQGSEIPYIAHLLAVCSLVLEDGGSEDEAIAALLHDAPEDQGGAQTLAEIRRRFDHRTVGEAVFERFNGRREGTLWYYSELGAIFATLHPGPMATELQRTVSKLRGAAGGRRRAG